MMNNILSIGIVIIGRNEGERLKKCLHSCLGRVESIVYVDSGSSDGSVELANSLGVAVLSLDLSTPFTAARARNEGVQKLTQINSDIKYIQFIDGDCELIDGWLNSAVIALENHDDVAIVCGRLKERFPEKSIYNRICDLEWNTPTGLVQACGGIFMIRKEIFLTLEGFDASLIAGEEPELCLRVRRLEKTILRLSDKMAWHDANMLHFNQWWKRSVRSGHAYAEGAFLYAKSSDKYCIKESVGIWLWAAIIPLIILSLTIFVDVLSLFLISIYPYKMYRIGQWASHLSDRKGDNWLYAAVCVFGKWPELIGQLKFYINRILGKKSKIIEHK